MKYRHIGVFALASLGLLSGCEGGGSDSDEIAGIDGTGDTVASGTIEGFGSVIVNGVRYNTDNADFIIDGLSGQQRDLSLGQAVVIRGSVNADGLNGTADEVVFNTSVLGPVGEVNVDAASINVLGQNIIVNDDTLFSEGLSLSGIDATSILKISGFTSAQGSILATRIDLVDPTSFEIEFEVTAEISDFDQASLTFRLNGLLVDYSGSNSTVVLADGLNVEVLGSLVRATDEEDRFLAREINVVESALAQPGNNLQLEGVVTRFISAEEFDLDGVPVVVNGETIYTDGAPADIALNAKLEIKGEVNAAGALVADKIQFLPSGEFVLRGVLDIEPLAGNELLLVKNSSASERILAGIRINDLTVFIDNSAAGLENFGVDDINFGEDYLEISGFAEPGNGDRFAATRVERHDIPVVEDLFIEGIARNVASSGLPACGDGLDNDSDGLTDFPSDTQCSSSTDISESIVEGAFPEALAHYTFDGLDWAVSPLVVPDSSADISNRHNGTGVSMGSNNTVPGPMGDALSFPGGVGYVDLGSFDIPGAALTLASWVYINDGSDCFDAVRCYLVSKSIDGDSAKSIWSIHLHSNPGSSDIFLAFGLNANTESISFIAAETPLSTETWHHVAVTYNGLSMSMFIDGQKIFQENRAGMIFQDDTAQVYLGRHSNTTLPHFDGVLDDTRIYTSALSEVQIATLANAMVPMNPCSDGVDNDDDGLIDFPDDPGCESTADSDEYNSLGADGSFTVLNYQIIISDVLGVAEIFDRVGSPIGEVEFLEGASGKKVRAEIDNPGVLGSPVRADRVILLE